VKCPHCTVSFFERWEINNLSYSGYVIEWDVRHVADPHLGDEVSPPFPARGPEAVQILEITATHGNIGGLTRPRWLASQA
jgi:hypothetical protein